MSQVHYDDNKKTMHNDVIDHQITSILRGHMILENFYWAAIPVGRQGHSLPFPLTSVTGASKSRIQSYSDWILGLVNLETRWALVARLTIVSIVAGAFLTTSAVSLLREGNLKEWRQSGGLVWRIRYRMHVKKICVWVDKIPRSSFCRGGK